MEMRLGSFFFWSLSFSPVEYSDEISCPLPLLFGRRLVRCTYSTREEEPRDTRARFCFFLSSCFVSVKLTLEFQAFFSFF